MEPTSKDIKLLFISNPSEAINECQKIICSVSGFNSYQEFYDYHLKNSHVSTCQNAWSTIQLSVHCDDCSNKPNSCICLQCFLNGNHENHSYSVNPYSSGNCDCGDLSFWKRSGFCKYHHGLDENSHPENYLDEKLRTTMTDIIFKCAFSAIKKLTEDDGTILSQIYQFLISFLKFGDGFRRLVVISLTERINFSKFFDLIFEAKYDFNFHLQQFCGLIVNDQLFKDIFYPIGQKLLIDKIIPISYEEMSSGIVRNNLLPWKSFWFHSLCMNKHQIDQNEFNLVEFSIQYLTHLKELFMYFGKERRNIPNIFYSINSLIQATAFLKDEEIQNYFDLLITKVLKNGTTKGIQNGINDTIIITSFKDQYTYDYFYYLNEFNYIFNYVYNVFKSKEKLKFDKLFDELYRSINIDQIFMIGKNQYGINNDKLVSKFIIQNSQSNSLRLNENFYKSFRNGGSFYFSYPTFNSLACLIRTDNLCRIKIAEFLKMEQFQSLRVKLTIITLKTIIAQICISQYIAPRNSNFGVLDFYSNIQNYPTFSDLGIPLLFPLLQLLIGLQNEQNDFGLKEFYAFEVAREIGLFDDDDDDDDDESNELNKERMIFSFIYFSLLLVIERTLFNFDSYTFIREQIIFQLKKGVSDLNELKNLFDLVVCQSSLSVLNKVIAEVAIPREKVNDVTFKLKDGIECNIISAINSIKEEKTMMNEIISKNPEHLLHIQEFESEETYFFDQNEHLNVHLKDFLFTPTVLAFVYKTLRKNDSSQKIDLNDHLAMNILVLISKFINESNDNLDLNHSFSENLIIKYDSSFAGLISQLKEFIYDYKVDSDGNATLFNTLNKKTFYSLMRIKIKSSNESPKSLIDLLLGKGEIGKNVLNKMSIQIESTGDEKEKQDLNKLKKNRAKKLKEDIINHYKTINLNFNKGDDDDDEIEKTLEQSNNDKEVCSICSNAQTNEILSYPLYIYRTKFPFIIDKPPLAQIPARISLKELSVDQDQDEDSLSMNEKDEDEIQDPELAFALLVSQMPELDIVNGMDEEEVQRRRRQLEILHQSVVDKYNQAKEEQEERKRQKQEKNQEKNESEKQLENPDSLTSKQITAGNLFVIQFGICQHLVHSGCVDKEDFSCPIDRSHKNGFLPNIDDLSTDSIYANKSNFELTSEMKDCLNLFIDKYSLFFKPENGRIVDVFVELIKSISGLISTYEVRLRSLPDCLDSKKTKLLSRNLFLTAWYAYRMKGKPTMKTGFLDDVSEDVESRLTTFQKFIKKLIECDELEESLMKKNESLQRIISSFKQDNEKEFCLFLRRVCLADHFLLMKNEDDDSKLIDWDEILSVENLSQKFHVSFNCDQFEFKSFIPAKMPKEFLRFALEPYNFPVEQSRHYTLFNIINYNQMIQCYNDLDDDDDDDVDYMSQLIKLGDVNLSSLVSFLIKKCSTLNYPSVFLFIGKESSSICIVDGKKYTIIKPFYLDKYGCADVDFQRRGPLFLNEERYERLIDQILSGDFSNGLKPFNQ